MTRFEAGGVFENPFDVLPSEECDSIYDIRANGIVGSRKIRETEGRE
jgi:hypothetical protein